MKPAVRNINFNIYASTEEEAERGRKAIIRFIDIIDQHEAHVSGNKLDEAMNKLYSSPFVFSQILKFFKN